MENKNIKIKMTTISTDSPVNVVKAKGIFRADDKRTLISFEKDGAKFAIIDDGEKIAVSSKSAHYSYRIPLKQDETLKGIMGDENTFLVVCKKAKHEKSEFDGFLTLEYILPDLSDRPLEFKVDIGYKF